MVEAGSPRAVLDACVLYPPVLRDILVGCAEDGLFAPVWSSRILAEWAHAAARGGPESSARAAAEIARLGARFPEAEVLPAEATEAALHLPDPADAHVLAAALDGGAPVLVTLNLRDFPARTLAPLGITAVSPDDLLMRLWLTNPEPVARAVALARGHSTAGLRSFLKRARLPRLGKALEAG
jgi:hypothetical protein